MPDAHSTHSSWSQHSVPGGLTPSPPPAPAVAEESADRAPVAVSLGAPLVAGGWALGKGTRGLPDETPVRTCKDEVAIVTYFRRFVARGAAIIDQDFSFRERFNEPEGWRGARSLTSILAGVAAGTNREGGEQLPISSWGKGETYYFAFYLLQKHILYSIFLRNISKYVNVTTDFFLLLLTTNYYYYY